MGFRHRQFRCAFGAGILPCRRGSATRTPLCAPRARCVASRRMSKSPPLTNWHPASWQARPASQQPKYADPWRSSGRSPRLSRLPPLVVSWEIEALRARLARGPARRGVPAAGRRLRGELRGLRIGQHRQAPEDSAADEPGAAAGHEEAHHPGRPVRRAVCQAALCGHRDPGGVTLPSYRGDNVNRPGFTAAEREPDPELLLRGYERASLTLNFVRALIDGGFADLHHPEYWDLGFLRHAALRDAYQKIVDSIAESLEFFESMSGLQVHAATRVEFYTSHEGLHLLSEQAQTRYIERQKKWYNLSTHMPWIGMRTAADRRRAYRILSGNLPIRSASRWARR